MNWPQVWLGRAYGLLGSASGGELHLLGLRLLNFLGRHIGSLYDSEYTQKGCRLCNWDDGDRVIVVCKERIGSGLSGGGQHVLNEAIPRTRTRTGSKPRLSWHYFAARRRRSCGQSDACLSPSRSRIEAAVSDHQGSGAVGLVEIGLCIKVSPYK
jgi:hypothetical protein